MQGKHSVAYFCMEFGLSTELPIYSGGLGVLAGDFMKSVGDLSLPITGVGLMWDEGYTTQLIGDDGAPEDHYVPTPRGALDPVEAELSVTVGGKAIPLRAFRIAGLCDSTIYLLEPAAADDRWITRRLYGGGEEDRIAQEIVLGVGGVRLLQALGIEPRLYHFNEGHAVFAGLELLRQRRAVEDDFEDAVAHVRKRIVFTTHTPVEAGNESHEIELMRRLGADVGATVDELEAIGGDPFNMTVAGLRLSHRANAVAELHGETAQTMWEHVADGAPIIPITNGVHVPTWQDARIRAATVADKTESRRSEELWSAHQTLKSELCAAIRERAGIDVRVDRLLIGFARRTAPYKRADLIFGDEKRLEKLFEDDRLQLVFSGKAHPANTAGKKIISRLVEATERWPKNVVFLENYDMTLGALLTRGCDVWLNNPRRPMEASGTSGMKAAMNGVLNLSILDGWWPEGCEHGVTGWQIGEPAAAKLSSKQLDARDRDALLSVLEGEVVPRYYDDQPGWVRMMENSVRMSSWRFSSDRMVEDYCRELYSSSES